MTTACRSGVATSRAARGSRPRAGQGVGGLRAHQRVPAHAGPVPTVRPPERCGLPALLAENVELTGAGISAGTAADAKALPNIGGMVAGADSIETWMCCDTATAPPVRGRARAVRSGHLPACLRRGRVRQLESALRAFTCHLALHSGLAPRTDEVAFVDIDSKAKQVHGPARQGASFGCTKQRGLHLRIVTVTTGTIRHRLINIPARIATGARRFTLHLPRHWRWEHDFADLWTATGHRLIT
ncbi:hypothetical protein ACFRQM_27490 [Streptomyces sp. NPDC056831]|uniref:hypothetical protein n=1 Tax=Streptomyces sp. NPDC056831 TaxID=3345954 RepID=UPI00368B1689